jgi:hypothetical protein
MLQQNSIDKVRKKYMKPEKGKENYLNKIIGLEYQNFI